MAEVANSEVLVLGKVELKSNVAVAHAMDRLKRPSPSNRKSISNTE